MNPGPTRPATPWAWMSAFAEFFGGIGLALGLLTPLPSLAIAGSMLVAIALVHWPHGFFTAKGGFEFNLSILAAVAAVAIAGAGAYSLDAALRISFPEPITLIVGTILLLIGVAVALGTLRSAAVPIKWTAMAAGGSWAAALIVEFVLSFWLGAP